MKRQKWSVKNETEGRSKTHDLRFFKGILQEAWEVRVRHRHYFFETTRSKRRKYHHSTVSTHTEWTDVPSIWHSYETENQKTKNRTQEGMDNHGPS